MALIGTYCSDSLGRRPMLIAGTTACATCLAFAMMCSAIATHGAATIPSSDSNQAGAKGAIAFLILFYGAYGLDLYPFTSCVWSRSFEHRTEVGGNGYSSALAEPFLSVKSNLLELSNQYSPCKFSTSSTTDYSHL